MADICRELGIKIPQVLLPNKNIDLKKWSVVACDQYTSEPEYWSDVENFVKDSPSTIHIVFPEVYLEKEDKDERICKINDTMNKYLKDNILVSKEPGFIYVERTVADNKVRKGLILAVDLEKYDYTVGSKSLIRATEGTVLERIPPRVKVRENAPLEVPHVMLLIDDPDKSVIEPIKEHVQEKDEIYNFELMMNSGSIKGYKITNKEVNNQIIQSFEKLIDYKNIKEKYGINSSEDILLFAVGDGNHSLATAKTCWEKIKKTLSKDEIETHPARYALVEVVNVYDDSLVFEPIHRTVFNVNLNLILEEMIKYYNSENIDAYYKVFKTEQDMNTELKKLSEINNIHVIQFVNCDYCGFLVVKNPKYNLEVGTLQAFLDYYKLKNDIVKIDYVHGNNTVKKLGRQKNNISFLLPPMDKYDLFKTVILDGALPRKTFSMGEANEKRFYLECRKIITD